MHRVFKKHMVYCHRCTKKNLTALIFLFRLLPFVQFDLVSYGAGLSSMSWQRFAVATFFGMIPPTILFTLTGSQFAIGNKITGVLLFIGIALSLIFGPTITHRFKLGHALKAEKNG